jgi:hypothetical protein
VDAPKRRPWLPAALLLGVVYLAVSFVSSRLLSGRMQIAGWVIQAAAFVGHVGYERIRRGSSVLETASHASLAVALGSIALALQRYLTWTLKLSLTVFAVWPLAFTLAAFGAAAALAAAIGRTRQEPPGQV